MWYVVLSLVLFFNVLHTTGARLLCFSYMVRRVRVCVCVYMFSIWYYTYNTLSLNTISMWNRHIVHKSWLIVANAYDSHMLLVAQHVNAMKCTHIVVYACAYITLLQMKMLICQPRKWMRNRRRRTLAKVKENWMCGIKHSQLNGAIDRKRLKLILPFNYYSIGVSTPGLFVEAIRFHFLSKQSKEASLLLFG